MTPSAESLAVILMAFLAVVMMLAWCEWKMRQINRRNRPHVLRLLRDLAETAAERDSWQKKLDELERSR